MCSVQPIAQPMAMSAGRSERISSVEGCATIVSVWVTPFSLSGEYGRLKPCSTEGSRSVREGDMAHQRDVIESEIPDASIHSPVCRECYDSSDHRPDND